MTSGHLLPSSHQPYESVAPLKVSTPRPLLPCNKGKVFAVPQTLPVTDAVGISEATWKQRTEVPEFDQGRMLAEQPAISEAFVDRPFCTGTPGVISLAEEDPAGGLWGIKGSYRSSRMSESPGHWQKRGLEEQPLISGNHGCRDTYLEMSPTLSPLSKSDHIQRCHTLGIDLTRVRESSSAVVFPPQQSSSFSSIEAKELRPCSVSLEDKYRNSLGANWEGWGWPQGCSVGAARASPWAITTNSLIEDVGWARPDKTAPQAIWGEGCGEEKLIDARYAAKHSHVEQITHNDISTDAFSNWKGHVSPTIKMAPTEAVSGSAEDLGLRGSERDVANINSLNEVCSNGYVSPRAGQSC